MILLAIIIIVNVAGVLVNVRAVRRLNASRKVYLDLAEQADDQLARLKELNDLNLGAAERYQAARLAES